MPKVLLTDDEPAILRSTEPILGLFGYDVVTNDRQENIVPLLERERPDVMLQDVRMPGLDVHELIPRVRDVLPNMPIILFSAGLELGETADDLGVLCIEKPFSPRELERVLRTALAAAPRA